MNRTLSIFFLGVALIVAGVVRADAAGPAGFKVGFVDLQRTLNETEPGKKARKKLERDKEKKQKELDKDQKELQQFAKDLEKQMTVLKPEVLRQRQAELQQKYVKLQETYMQLQQDLAKTEAALVRDIFTKASPIIQAIAKEQGFSMILEKNESAVLWANSSLDITDAVNKGIK
jgi:outer membrane protein